MRNVGSGLRLLLAAQAVSQVGDWIRDMALLLWVFRASAESPWAQAALMVAQHGPALVAGPLGGWLVDRVGAHPILFHTNLIRAALGGILWLAVADGRVWWAIPVVALSAAAGQVFLPARTVAIRAMVPEGDRVRVASAMGGISSTLTVLGPALGTWMYARFGAAMAVVIDTATFLVAALLVRRLPVPGVDVPPPLQPRLLQGLMAGAQQVVRDRVVRALFLSTLALLVGSGATGVATLFLIRQSLNLPVEYIAWVQASHSLSMLAANILLADRAGGKLPAAATWMAGLAFSSAGMGLVASATGAATLLGGASLVGLGEAAALAAASALLQNHVPISHLGRVSGAYQALARLAVTVGATGAGAGLASLGPRPVLALAAATAGVGLAASGPLIRRHPGTTGGPGVMRRGKSTPGLASDWPRR